MKNFEIWYGCSRKTGKLQNNMYNIMGKIFLKELFEQDIRF